MKRITIFLLKSVIIICCIVICNNLFLYYKDSKSYDSIKKLKPEIHSSTYTDSSSEIKVSDDTSKTSKLNSLNTTNTDYTLWINIPNTNIDYPVVQTSDNNFYLTHDFNKNYSKSGCIFMDYRNNFYIDRNLIIYGHNMLNNTMFSSLTDFKSKDFFKDNNYIEILKDGKLSTYEVFSVYTEKKNNMNLQLSFHNDSLYLEYINTLADKSLYQNNTNLTANSSIITLITCSYEYPNARTIVHAINRD